MSVGDERWVFVETPCPLCGSTDRVFPYGRDQRIRESVGQELGPRVVKCRECSVVYLSPVMESTSMDRFYDLDRQKEFVAAYIREDYQHKTAMQTAYRLRLLKDYLSESSDVLDIGCGYCSFLLAIKDRVRSVTGIEMSQRRAEYGRAQGVRIVHGSLADWTVDEKPDVVTMFHVLEHIVDVRGFLRELLGRMKTTSIVAIEIPSLDDLIVSLAKYRWYYFQNAHVVYYGRLTLHRLLTEAGFDVVREVTFQRYGLGNHLHWLFEGKPGEYRVPSLLDRLYRRWLQVIKRTDTVFVIARAKEGQNEQNGDG